jgi:transcriptional regulator with XRE-family HTH domain
MYKNIGNKISILRKEAGLTQQEMATKIGISRSALVKVENSQRALSLEESVAISNVLGVSIDTLLDFGKQEDEKTFVMAFKAKGMPNDKIDEIARYELLFDVFITQEEIFKGE